MGLFGSSKTKVKVIDPYAGTGIREMYQQLNQMFTPLSQGLTPYGDGQIVPGASPLQQQGFSAAQGLTPLATAGQEYFGGALGQADPGAPQRYMGQAEQGLQQQMQPFDPTMAMQAMEPARQLGLQSYKEDVVPWIMERYGPAMGAKESGAMGRELARGGERLGLGVSAQLAPYLYAGKQAQLGRQANIPSQYMNLAGLPGQVLGQAGQIGGMGANLLGQQMNIGGMQRGITAEQMQEPYMRFQQPYSPQMMNLLQMALGQQPNEIVAQQQPAGMGYSMLSGLAPGIGLGMGQAGLGGVMGGLGGLAGGAAGLLGGAGSAALGGLGALAGLI